MKENMTPEDVKQELFTNNTGFNFGDGDGTIQTTTILGGKLEMGPDPQSLNSDNPTDKADRYNKGKHRLGLIPEFSRDQLASVLTAGAEKYDDNNWRKGLSWSGVLDSLERHLNAFKNGEDYDPESGCLHTAHIITNAMFLTEYYKIYPQGDDRPHQYLRYPKIGLDIDEVLCDWVGAWCERFDLGDPQHWDFSYNTREQFHELEESEELEEFYLNLEPLIEPSDLPFEPHCYITSRSIPSHITKQWIEKWGFPTVEVHTVGHNKSKVEVAKEAGIEWFVDDKFSNFSELNNAGICTFLMDRPHNRKYNVGHKRISSLDDLFNPVNRG